jgi:hypothetical protein
MPDTPSQPTSPGLPNDTGKQPESERASALPQPTGSPVREKQFPIRHDDWLQLRKKVARLKEPVPYLASVGWTCVGIMVAALLALLVWPSIDSELPAKAHIHYTFITPLLAIGAVASAVIAIFAFVVGHQTKQIRIIMVDNVLIDMDNIYEPYSHA